MKYTILMSVYKADTAKRVKIALESTRKNLNLPTEYLIYIDGPIDPDVKSVIEDFAIDLPVRVVESKANTGLANAINQLLPLVETEFVARVDADDENKEGRFDRQIEFILKERIDVCGGQIEEWEERTNTILGKRIVPIDHLSIAKLMKFRSPMNHMTVMMKSSYLRKVGGYPIVHFAEDYALWVKMYRSGATYGNVDEILVKATVDERFYNRRSGVRYLTSQLKLQKFLRNEGLVNSFEFYFNIVVRTAIALCPNEIRRRFYLLTLRTKA